MFSPNDPADLLRQSEFFDVLTPEELQHLGRAVIARSFDSGAEVIREGDPGDSLVLIVSGSLDVLRAVGSPDERVIDTAGPGSVLGEMSLFINDGRRNATVRATSPVTLLELPHAVFTQVLQDRPDLTVDIVRAIAGRLLRTDRRTIGVLQERNHLLAETLDQLQAAQQELIEMEKLEHELQLARRIQQQLLPREIPLDAGWNIDAHWQPASTVSGDFYDFLRLQDGRLAIVMGDVSGKGMGAALVMATTRTVIRATSRDHVAPREILTLVNDFLAPDMTPGIFVTCGIAVLDPGSGDLTLANAGHCLPIIHTQAEVKELRATGMPLGLIPGSDYDEISTRIDPGDSVTFYSDGLIEARPTGDAFLGVEGVKTLLAEIAPTQSPIPALLDAITGPGIETDHDDVTIVHISRS